MCKRFGLDISHRTLHGALKDADLLSQVFQNLTTQQGEWSTIERKASSSKQNEVIQFPDVIANIVSASEQENSVHQTFLKDVLNTDPLLWS